MGYCFVEVKVELLEDLLLIFLEIFNCYMFVLIYFKVKKNGVRFLYIECIVRFKFVYMKVVKLLIL